MIEDAVRKYIIAAGSESSEVEVEISHGRQQLERRLKEIMVPATEEQSLPELDTWDGQSVLWLDAMDGGLVGVFQLEGPQPEMCDA